MNFWLKHNDTDKFKLPVTPEKFEVTVDHKNTVVNIVSLGDINLLGKTGLKAVSLSSFFPAQDYSFAKADADEPKNYVSKIESWRKNNDLVRFVISGVVNVQCSIESFDWGMKDGTGDIYYTISLKEYRAVSTKKRTQKKVKATTHKIKKGDTLSKIAKKYYGKNTKELRDKVYKANKKIIKNKSKLPKGKKIKIPATTVTSWK